MVFHFMLKAPGGYRSHTPLRVDILRELHPFFTSFVVMNMVVGIVLNFIGGSLREVHAGKEADTGHE